MITLLGLRTHHSGPAMTAKGNRHGSADRLRLMLGLSVSEYDRMFQPGKRLNVENRENGMALRGLVRGPCIVLGREAWMLLGLPPCDFFSTMETGRATFLLVPHPSGRNRAYNRKQTVTKARQTITKFGRGL